MHGQHIQQLHELQQLDQRMTLKETATSGSHTWEITYQLREGEKTIDKDTMSRISTHGSNSLPSVSQRHSNASKAPSRRFAEFLWFINSHKT